VHVVLEERDRLGYRQRVDLSCTRRREGK
jgi:hypothetical protein